MRVAIATFEGMPPEFAGDDRLLVAKLRERGLEVDYVPWSRPDFDWSGPALVHARSPWDYARRHGEFIRWVRSVGARLENAPELIEWNSDKRYLADLAAAGIPVVRTCYVGPGEKAPAIEEPAVVKPAISAGARDTGRFGPGSAAHARELIERITAGGGTAMVQPFLPTVETHGETAVVTIAGQVSHVLHKRAVLGSEGVAPIRADGLGVAEAMYDPELVGPGEAEPDELALAGRVIGLLHERFGRAPLVARVDMLRDGRGHPILLELEAIEPNLYFDQTPEAADRLVEAILARAERGDAVAAPSTS